jgi:hypothetical protein
MTVGGLIHNLTIFADFYERASADIERAEPVFKPSATGNRDANSDNMQREFRATVAIDRVRTYVLAEYGADLTIGTARRLLGDLIRICALTVDAAESLPLETAMDRLDSAESRKDKSPADSAENQREELSLLETVEAVKRRVYGEQYEGPAGPIPAWEGLPALLEAIIRECKRLDEDRIALREFREKSLESFRESGANWIWTPDLTESWRPADAELNALRERLNEDEGEEGTDNVKGSKRPQRSTERGEGRAKLIAALTKHHQYADGGCLNPEPIGNNELANAADVAPSTASAFFNNEFQGHMKYRAVCRDAGKLADSLKALNGEFSPYELYGRRPPGEDNRDNEGDD